MNDSLKSASGEILLNDPASGLVDLIDTNEEILRFFLRNPTAEIKDLQESGVTGLAYSTLVKRVGQLREAKLLAQAHRLNPQNRATIMEQLFRKHYFIGIIVNPKEVYRKEKESRKRGKEALVTRVLQEGLAGHEKTVVVSVSMILGADTEIILNVYTNEDTYGLIESLRRVRGVHSTRTYEVVKELRSGEILDIQD